MHCGVVHEWKELQEHKNTFLDFVSKHFLSPHRNVHLSVICKFFMYVKVLEYLLQIVLKQLN